MVKSCRCLYRRPKLSAMDLRILNLKNILTTVLPKVLCFFLTILTVQSYVSAQTWAERLGFPTDSKVIILHADDVGMCEEANIAAIKQLTDDEIQSASVMVPCPAFSEIATWSANNPIHDVGLHLTLTSEWKTHRWSTVMPTPLVKGLLDEEGKMWHSVPQVVDNATAEEVERELRAQIETAIRAGMQPSHLDTHMGTLYAHNDFTEIYFRLAEEYEIPAMVIEFADSALVEKYRGQGYPITERLIEMVKKYRLPKLDFFTSVPSANTYADKKNKFKEVIRSLPNGLSEIIFHPAQLSDNLKSITNSWQQRVWEADMFRDPEIVEFLEQEEIIFTNWKEIMGRHTK